MIICPTPEKLEQTLAPSLRSFSMKLSCLVYFTVLCGTEDICKREKQSQNMPSLDAQGPFIIDYWCYKLKEVMLC